MVSSPPQDTIAEALRLAVVVASARGALDPLDLAAAELALCLPGLAEDALEQTVTLLVYVPVFAYTFAASLPAEEQFVLGLVVILVVGSFAKQDD